MELLFQGMKKLPAGVLLALVSRYESRLPQLFAAGVALPAMLMDLWTERVSNWWLLFSAVSCLLLRGVMEGTPGIFRGLQGMLLPVLILFPLFLLRMMGAGDIKLLGVLGILLGRERILVCIWGAFLSGALLSLLLMLKRRIFMERMRYFVNYLQESIGGKQRIPYRQEGKYRPETIHFTVPVCISLFLCLGGVI